MLKYMKWIEALKLWNSQHNKGAWCVPRKGSPEHAVVKSLMGETKESKEAKAKAEAAEEMAAVPSPKKKKTVRISEEPEIDYDKMYKEERVKEITAKSKKTKVKAFLKKLIEKSKAKKAAKAVESKVGSKDVVMTRDELIAELPAITKKDTKVIYPMLYKISKNEKADYHRFDPGSAAGRNTISGGHIATRTAAQMRALLEDNFPASAVFDVHTAHEDKNSLYLYMKRHSKEEVAAASAVGAGAGDDVRDYFIEEGESSVMRADEYENAFMVNMNLTLKQAQEAAERVMEKHPEQAVFYKYEKNKLKVRKYIME